MTTEKKVVAGYKGFHPDWTCSGGERKFQYEVGKTFTHEGPVVPCQSGLHLCENPLDVLAYYNPSSKFAEVEGRGTIAHHSDDSKVACSELHVKAEISLSALIGAGIKFVFDRVDWSKGPEATKEGEGAIAPGNSGAASATGYRGAASATGDRGAASATGYSGAASATGYSGAASATGDSGAASATGDRGAASATGYSGAASATGYRGAASATGDRGAASATGDRGAASATGYRGAASATGDSGAASATGDSGAASATGKHSIACGLGVECRAQAALGCWIVLAEREHVEGEGYVIKSVKTAKVDGKKIKAETWYMLIDGKFTEAQG